MKPKTIKIIQLILDFIIKFLKLKNNSKKVEQINIEKNFSEKKSDLIKWEKWKISKEKKEFSDNWTIEKYNEKDFFYKRNIIETPSNNFFNTWKKEYRQTKNMCFIFWAIWCVSDNTWYKFSKDETMEIEKQVLSSWKASKKTWWTMWVWMNAVVNFYNNNIAKKWTKLIYYRLPHYKFNEFLDKWYSIQIAYHSSKDLLKDRGDDWILNFSLWDYNDEWYWHCVRFTKKSSDDKIFLINNYPKRKNNIWEIKNLDDFFIKNIFFKYWYICLIEEEWVKDWFSGLSIEDKIKKLNPRKEVEKARKIIKENRLKK